MQKINTSVAPDLPYIHRPVILSRIDAAITGESLRHEHLGVGHLSMSKGEGRVRVTLLSERRGHFRPRRRLKLERGCRNRRARLV